MRSAWKAKGKRRGVSIPPTASRDTGSSRGWPFSWRRLRVRHARLDRWVLAALFSWTLAASGQSQGDAQPVDVLSPSLISVDKLASILRAEKSSAFPEEQEEFAPELVRAVLEKVAQFRSVQQESIQRGEAIEGECLAAIRPGVEDALVTRGPFRSTTLPQLAANAKEMFVVKILVAEQFLSIHSTFASFYVAEVIEHWGASSSPSMIGQSLQFYRPDFDFSVGGERFCALREGLQRPAPDEEWLLLSTEAPREDGLLIVSNFFPLSSGNVLFQDYEFLVAESSWDLEDIKRAFSSAHGG